MATGSSSKKIQRVQQAGVTRAAGQRRNVVFPGLIAFILIAGSVLVLLARDARINKDGERPVLGTDQWFSAFGTYDCGEYGGILDDVEGGDGAQLGIHSHGDGLIAIHPTEESVAGENATLGKFFDAVGITVTDDSWTQPGDDGEETHAAGDSCGSGDDATTDTVVRLLQWPPQASNKTEPKVYESDFASVRLLENGQTFLLALLPEDAEINDVDLPPSSNNIDSPNPEPVPTETTVTEPSVTASTVPGSTSPETTGDPAATPPSSG